MVDNKLALYGQVNRLSTQGAHAALFLEQPETEWPQL